MSANPHLVRLYATATRQVIPLEVSIELTHRCVFDCVHCYLPERRDRDGLSLARLLLLLDELVEMGTLHLTLTGGEPLLYRHWPQVAERARRLGFTLGVLSNGALVDEETADTLARLSAQVDVSLYSMDPSVFEGITRCPGSYEQTLGGIELLANRGVELRIKVPLTRRSCRGVGAVFDYAESIGAACYAMPRLFPCTDGDLAPVDLRLGPDDLLWYCRSSFSGCTPPAEVGDPGPADAPPCAAGVRTACITPRGEVRACHLLPESAGSISEQPFREIWQGSPWLRHLRSIRRQDLETCGTCHRFAYCKRCPAQALLEDGDLLGPASWSCRRAEAVEQAFAEPVAAT